MSSPSPRRVAADTLKRLREGNQRFVSQVRSLEVLGRQAHQPELASGQEPIAIVLTCSDSRVPSELIFDCGLGDLFVVRVAGNVVAPSLVGSVEFAAAKFGTPLVAVVGHTGCGAVDATLEALQRPTAPLSENIHDIVQRIAPALAELLRNPSPDHEALRRSATRANVRASVNQLRHGSRLLEQRIAAGQLAVVGGEYSLETGRVEFFDVPPGLD